MAGIKPSVIVSEILGKAGSVVFSKWKGRAYVRSLVTPANPDTNDQQCIRGIMRKVVAWWHDLPAAVVDAIKSVASYTDLTANNLFIQRNAEDILLEVSTPGSPPPKRVWPDPPEAPDDPAARIMPLNTPVNAVDTVAAEAGSGAGEIDITWDQGPAQEDDTITVLAELHSTPYDESGLFAATPTNVTVQTETLTLTALSPGAVYDLYVMVKDHNTAGFSIARPVKATAKAA